MSPDRTRNAAVETRASLFTIARLNVRLVDAFPSAERSAKTIHDTDSIVVCSQRGEKSYQHPAICPRRRRRCWTPRLDGTTYHNFSFTTETHDSCRTVAVSPGNARLLMLVVAVTTGYRLTVAST